MRVHSFNKGDVVTVFQMHPRKGLEIEGKATVLKLIKDVDEQYLVRFHGSDGKPSLWRGEECERFVDRDGQADPTRYIRQFNTKIGFGT